MEIDSSKITSFRRELLLGLDSLLKRKQAEEALAEMTRKLIESQEQERARIGRELHDDINQKLAMVALELDQLITREMIRTGQPAEGEWRVVWPDGSVHWIAGRGQVLMDESGKPSRMLGVNMDVTRESF